MAILPNEYRFAPTLLQRLLTRRVMARVGYVGLVGLTAYSAVVAKESRIDLPLIRLSVEPIAPESLSAARALEHFNAVASQPQLDVANSPLTSSQPLTIGPPLAADQPVLAANGPELPPIASPGLITPRTRWFGGRAVRPVKTIEFLVTAYSPDAASCGEFADGLTATLHSVETNAFRLVAADPKVLPYGSMITVPGYAENQIVPVLDCGGKIKGNRLDLLFPTHEQAIAWGVKRLTVTIWEPIDGQGLTNPRLVR
jgi:3D (Asp-Asp-Asp) domain-containing protein